MNLQNGSSAANVPLLLIPVTPGLLCFKFTDIAKIAIAGNAVVQDTAEYSLQLFHVILFVYYIII